MEDKLIKKYYNEYRDKGFSPAVAKIKAITAAKEHKAPQPWAKTRTKSARESFNWYKITNMSGATASFIENTNMRTLKKIIKNNFKELESTKGKTTKRKANNAFKKIDNYQGSKIDLVLMIDKQYGSILRTNSMKLNDYKSKSKPLIRETYALTKAGKARKRYAKPTSRDKSNKMMKAVDRGTKNNFDRATWRVFKTRDFGDSFDEQGIGIVSAYFFDTIAGFSSMNGANLGDMEHELVARAKPIYVKGTIPFYEVELTKKGKKILKHWQSPDRRRFDQTYSRKILDVEDIKKRFGSDYFD